jgi:ribosomal protein L21E
MNKMTEEELLDRLAGYGYPLLKTAGSPPEELLENLLEQDDVRLLEGFPVVFSRMLKEADELRWEKKDWRPLSLSPKVRLRLPFLLALTLLLLKLQQAEKRMEQRTSKLLFKFPKGKEVLAAVSPAFANARPVHFDGLEFSVERLQNTFETFALQPVENKTLETQKRELETELLLSELFTPRQKALLKKRRERRPFTKTEREYFSRVLKKRLRALASAELHRFAHQLLYES